MQPRFKSIEKAYSREVCHQSAPISVPIHCLCFYTFPPCNPVPWPVCVVILWSVGLLVTKYVRLCSQDSSNPHRHQSGGCVPDTRPRGRTHQKCWRLRAPDLPWPFCSPPPPVEVHNLPQCCLLPCASLGAVVADTADAVVGGLVINIVMLL